MSIIYTLTHGTGEEGLRMAQKERDESTSPNDPNPRPVDPADFPETKNYVYDDGKWVQIEEGSDEWLAVNQHMSETKNLFALCFIPHEALTLDENGIITDIKMPGD